MDKNVCIAQGCPFYRKTTRPRFINGMVDCMPRYMCGFYCREVKDVKVCNRK